MPEPASAVRALYPPRLLDGGAALELVLDDTPCRFHACWLRENAQDVATRSPGNGQRLITLLDFPPDTVVADARWTDEGLCVRFAPGDRVINYAADWLTTHAYDRPQRRLPGWTSESVVRWDAGFIGALEMADFAHLHRDAPARLRWLKQLERFGFVRLRGGAPAEIAALFGYVRETNYGRVFDVRSEVDPGNLAYTNLGLQPHTDNPYRDAVPGIQILSCVRNAVAGGESIVVDGFAVAQHLQAESPDGFGLLASYNARFDYAGTAGVRLRAKRPIIELGVDGELRAVRFNNRSAAPFIDIPYAAMASYYAAYRRFAELIGDPAFALRFRLGAGDSFVVDNRRVLHARTAITGPGTRHLQGCYADWDGLLSTIAVLEQQGIGR